MSKTKVEEIKQELEELHITNDENPTIEKPKTKEEKELELLETEYHKLSLIALVLEQRYKIKQLQAALTQFEIPVKEEAKVKTTETAY